MLYQLTEESAQLGILLDNSSVSDNPGSDVRD